MSELKPCPKCSLNGAPLRRIGEMDEYRVECVECYTVKTPWFKTLKEAEDYWNAFAEGMKQQAARIAGMEAERDRLREAEIPVFVTQLEINGQLVKDINKFPPELQIRQIPWKRVEK